MKLKTVKSLTKPTTTKESALDIMAETVEFTAQGTVINKNGLWIFIGNNNRKNTTAKPAIHKRNKLTSLRTTKKRKKLKKKNRKQINLGLKCNDK